MGVIAILAILLAAEAPPPKMPPQPRPAEAVTVVSYTAAWCGACRKQKPILDRLRAEGVAVRIVDYDRAKADAVRHNISRLPTTLVVRGRAEVGRVVGVASLERLRSMVESVQSDRKAALSIDLETQ